MALSQKDSDMLASSVSSDSDLGLLNLPYSCATQKFLS